MTPTPRRSRARDARAFTLVEATLSVLIVAVMLVAALSTLGATGLLRRQTEQVAAGPLLAQELMNEILSKAYEEPVDSPQFGREEGESGGHREAWDDVDDYDGWSASPPEWPDDTPQVAFAGWERSVSVAWVDPAAPDQVHSSPTGVKRITVTVRRDGRMLGSLTALRTAAWPGN
jgi:type II secretory pathway pseudopilin PulG